MTANLLPGLSLSLSFTVDLEDRLLARNVLEELLSAPERLRPRRFGAFHPERRLDDPEAVLDTLVNAAGPRTGPRAGSLVLGHSKNCGFQVQWNKSSQPGFSFIGGYLMFAAIDKDPQALADFVELARRLVAALAPAYGEIRSMAVKGWDAPMNLQLRLPDVPPISIYGREYIELFGRDAIEAAPFQSVERVGEAYWLVASESLREGVGDEARARIRAHFGEDAFMANGKWKYQDGRAPHFDLSWSVA